MIDYFSLGSKLSTITSSDHMELSLNSFPFGSLLFSIL